MGLGDWWDKTTDWVQEEIFDPIKEPLRKAIPKELVDILPLVGGVPGRILRESLEENTSGESIFKRTLKRSPRDILNLMAIAAAATAAPGLLGSLGMGGGAGAGGGYAGTELMFGGAPGTGGLGGIFGGGSAAGAGAAGTAGGGLNLGGVFSTIGEAFGLPGAGVSAAGATTAGEGLGSLFGLFGGGGAQPLTGAAQGGDMGNYYSDITNLTGNGGGYGDFMGDLFGGGPFGMDVGAGSQIGQQFSNLFGGGIENIFQNPGWLQNLINQPAGITDFGGGATDPFQQLRQQLQQQMQGQMTGTQGQQPGTQPGVGGFGGGGAGGGGTDLLSLLTGLGTGIYANQNRTPFPDVPQPEFPSWMEGIPQETLDLIRGSGQLPIENIMGAARGEEELAMKDWEKELRPYLAGRGALESTYGTGLKSEALERRGARLGTMRAGLEREQATLPFTTSIPALRQMYGGGLEESAMRFQPSMTGYQTELARAFESESSRKRLQEMAGMLTAGSIYRPQWGGQQSGGQQGGGLMDIIGSLFGGGQSGGQQGGQQGGGIMDIIGNLFGGGQGGGGLDIGRLFGTIGESFGLG